MGTLIMPLFKTRFDKAVPTLDDIIKEAEAALLYDPLRDMRELPKHIPSLIAVLNAIKEKKIKEQQESVALERTKAHKLRYYQQETYKDSYINAPSYNKLDAGLGGYIGASDYQNKSRYMSEAAVIGGVAAMIMMHFRHKKR